MAKRFITENELAHLPTLPIMLPKSAHRSDPFSHGERPELYGADDLKKIAIEKQARTDEFEKRLVGIWWALDEAPVPYVFRTQDGTVRSLDAGCVGFLLNRWRPEIDLVETAGTIVAVRPIGELASRYLQLKDRLIANVRALTLK